MPSSKLVEKNFSRSAATYDLASGFQRKAAAALSEFAVSRISCERIERVAKAVEFGCGTGFLTSHLLKIFPASQMLATDISEEMLNLCRKRLGSIAEGRASFARHDFNEAPRFGRVFDLAASSLAFQWGGRLDATLLGVRRCLAKDGILLFSVPLSSSLGELRELFASEGVPFPGLSLPDAKGLEAALGRLFKDVAVLERGFDDGAARPLKELLRRLQLSGTVNASGKLVPLPPLRRLLRQAGSRSVKARYEVAFCLCEHERS